MRSLQRSPFFSRNVVTTSHPLAAEAGLQIMRKGGNAVDAAIAAAISLTVLEPTASGIGGDAFAMVWDGVTISGLNASGRSGRNISRALLDNKRQIPRNSWAAVTVPGAVAGWAELSLRFGRLSFGDLFVPAITYAELGAHLPPSIAKLWKALLPTYRASPALIHLFSPNGRAPDAGDLIRLPSHAKTLREIAETGGESFYRGRLASEIVMAGAASGFGLCREDLSEHVSEWVSPLSVNYRDHVVFELPPNGQGVAALNALGILNKFDLTGYAKDSAVCAHLQIEAMKLGFADVYQYISDRDFLPICPKALLAESYLMERAGQVDLCRARFPRFGRPRDKGTVSVVAADSNGMMISLMQSNGGGFGSGIVIPNTGICMHDRGTSFSLDELHPNCIGPRKKPFHSVAPAFVSFNGKPVAALGVVGFNMQPQAHLQMISRLVDYHADAQEICDAARWRIAYEEPAIVLEEGFNEDAEIGLVERGHVVVETEEYYAASSRYGSALAFGSAQLVLRVDGGYCAASDRRRDGEPVGW